MKNRKAAAVLPIKTMEALKIIEISGARSQSVTRRLGDTTHLSIMDVTNPYQSTIHQYDKRQQAEITIPKGSIHALSMKDIMKDVMPVTNLTRKPPIIKFIGNARRKMLYLT
jgi:hypothetical protein